jgi:hypothetical protein
MPPLQRATAASFQATNGRTSQEETMNGVVTVRVPQNLTLEQAQRVVAAVVAKTGHNTCFSGFDIRFTNAVDYAVQANTLEVREIA